MAQPIEPSTPPKPKSEPEVWSPSQLEQYLKDHPEEKAEITGLNYRGKEIWRKGEPALVGEAHAAKVSSIDKELWDPSTPEELDKL